MGAKHFPYKSYTPWSAKIFGVHSLSLLLSLSLCETVSLSLSLSLSLLLHFLDLWEMEERLTEPNPKTCVVLGGRGFIGKSLVHRLLRLGKWIVRVADSAHSLQLDSSSESDSLLSQAIASARASYHQVDLRDFSQIVRGN